MSDSDSVSSDSSASESMYRIALEAITNKDFDPYASDPLPISLPACDPREPDNVDAWNACSASRMLEAFMEMRLAYCANCDYFFHCKSYYDAVQRCSGYRQRATAELMSAAQERLGNSNTNNESLNSTALQEAKEFGRSGGSCDEKYLAPNGTCHYNPYRRRCYY